MTLIMKLEKEEKLEMTIKTWMINEEGPCFHWEKILNFLMKAKLKSLDLIRGCSAFTARKISNILLIGKENADY